MKLNFDIKKQEFNIVSSILSRYVPAGCKVWVFGSRVKGQAQDYSDLDLALEADKKIDTVIIARLKYNFEESRLPYTVDVLDMNAISEKFQKAIDTHKIAFPLKQKNPLIRFKQDDGSDFPDWQEKQLGEVAEIFMGSSPKSEHYNGIQKGEPLFQGNADIKNRRTVPRVWTTEITQRCFVNDILMSVRAPVGDIALSVHNGIIGRGMCAIRTSSYTFFYYALINAEHLWKKYSQGSTFESVNSRDIKEFQIGCPSLPEQQKIVSFLESVDTKIQLLERKVVLLQSYKKGIMQKLFSQELRFKDEQGNEYPDWQEREIGEIFYVTRGLVLSKTDISPIQTDHYVYPVFSSQTKNKGLMGYYHKYLFENCITWTTDGANAGDVNYRKGKFYCTNVCGVLKSDKGYANVCIAEILNAITKKFVSYVGNPKLMNDVMSSIRIKIPASIKEQQKIGSFLQSLDTKISLTQKQVALTKLYKKGLLQRMFV